MTDIIDPLNVQHFGVTDVHRCLSCVLHIGTYSYLAAITLNACKYSLT
jgi:hypothetical protein